MLDDWLRLEQGGTPVFVRPDGPDWFVPDPVADRILVGLKSGQTPAGYGEAGELAAHRLLSRLAAPPAPPYPGRRALLALTGLKECWFHLTDRCNLACRHCLFSASPARTTTLPRESLLAGLRQAKELGTRIFYFTGGEPFLYPDFIGIVGELLADPEVRVVVLSNGLLLKEHASALRALPGDRFHLQLSLDGMAERHEALRGKGSFAGLLAGLALLIELDFSPTLSVAVNQGNYRELAEIVAFASGLGVKGVHFLWHFVRGQGTISQFVAPELILPELIRAQEKAEECGLELDNVESLRAQVFSTPGTRHDLANTAWESLAVGPDGLIYPSPALVGIAPLACGRLEDGLAKVWRESPVLKKIRRASLIDSPACLADPLHFLTGGGDLDHSFLSAGNFAGHDPYLPLYYGLALWLIARQARQYPLRSRGEILLRMGEVRRDCPDGGREVSLTHCNCVISLGDGRTKVREFYGQAAQVANAEIVNPFAPEQAEAGFIPKENKKKSYGCGSPVKDAALRPGEVLVDLGSGSGVECFMAAAAVGPGGRVIGIDMTEEMLHLARESKRIVAQRLGYDNTEFKQGFLEDLPLADGLADVVISNCVINLSPDKRRTMHEIHRVLKPGGRLVVSDIVSDGPIPAMVRNDQRLRGECLGGALPQEELMAMLRAAGFSGARLLKRFPYREEGGAKFYSLTFQADKPVAPAMAELIYRGPFAAVWTESGAMLLKGKRTRAELNGAESRDDCIFILDSRGAVGNLPQEGGCCGVAPQPPAAVASLALAGGKNEGCCGSGAEGKAKETVAKIVPLAGLKPVAPPARHHAGCMVCGEEIGYLPREQDALCHYCGGRYKSNALCGQGHFVCDSCHQQDGLSAIRLFCAETKEQDMLALLAAIRRHPAIPMHGPEHHAMLPGIILATYLNRGGGIGREEVLAGIERGARVPGGVCGFWGNCGAAAGVGIAFSVLLAATPLTPGPRQQVQEITARVLGEIARTTGARCCQRETVTALKAAAEISRGLLPVPLLAEAEFVCAQSARNRECVGAACSLWGAARSAYHA